MTLDKAGWDALRLACRPLGWQRKEVEDATVQLYRVLHPNLAIIDECVLFKFASFFFLPWLQGRYEHLRKIERGAATIS